MDIETENHFEEFVLGFKVIDESSKKQEELIRTRSEITAVSGDFQNIDLIDSDESSLKEIGFEENKLEEKKKKKNIGCCDVIRRKNTEEETIDYWQD